jgi:hypothetical protein
MNAMLPLTITLTKRSNDRHVLCVTRIDGSAETRELTSREFLFHDLLHFAVEAEAGLAESFYGSLANGAHLDALSRRAAPVSGEALVTERIIGVLTGAIKGDVRPREAITAAANLFGAHGEPLPDWFTESFVDRVRERMRQLIGEWKAVPFGGSMTLRFPDRDEPVG